MFNLLQSDLYRILRVPFFWVITAVLIICVVASAGLMNWISSPEFAGMVNDSVVEQGMQGLSEAEQAEMRDDLNESVAELETLNDKMLDSITSTWASTFLDGGFLGFMGSLFVALYLLADFKKGFVKNLPMDRQGRLFYYAEKLIFIAVVQLFFLGICAGMSTAAFAVFGFSYEIADSLGEIALWLGLAWLICVAYACIVACLCWAWRSELLSAIAAAVLSSGVFGAFLIQLCLFLGKMIPVFGVLAEWLPASTFADLRGGAQGLLSVDHAGLFAQIPASLHVVIVTILAVVVMCIIIFTACRRKDIS